VVSYDDLLLILARALEDEDAERLAALISNQFKAALIDEFQDTDPLQYQIFSRIYQDSKSTLLYIIGDPKQAIYSFRGADVFSYLEAVRSADTRDNLGFNFRSEPGLIRAVNTLFSQRDFPFLFEEIPFSPAAPAAVGDSDRGNRHNGEIRTKGEKEALTFNGKSEPPLQLWLGSRPQGESGLVNKAEATQSVVSALAYEVCTLLTGGRNGEIIIGDRPLQAGDIAVLVRRNKEAGQVLEGLKQFGIGGVIQAGDDLFKSREAEELELVLQAVADPFNETAVRSALTTDLLPGTVATVAELESERDRLASWCQRFQEYCHLWQIKGFMAMFRFLLEREGIRSQALHFFDGERRLTNVLHLGESLDRYTREYHKGMASVLRYLSENRQSREGDVPEERQMRLESDEDRVRIVTVHTSKGLQYPVVFCPFAWGGGDPSKQEEVLFHRDEDLRPCLDLGSTDWQRHKEIARRETLAEELRLLYVALTRAINRCYLVWGPFNTAQKSALGWLLHGSSGSGGSSPSVPQIALKEMSDEDIFSDLESLKSQAGGEIEINPLPGEECFLTPRLDQETGLEGPVFRGNIPRDFRIASFSYMVDQGRRSREEMTGEGYFLHNREEESFFPRGAKTGNLFHDLLESLDFQEISGGLLPEGEQEDSPAAFVEARLRDYGFTPVWRDAVGEILTNTVNTLLDDRDLRLKDVDRSSRLCEMEFYFPLSKTTGGLLSEVLTSHGGVYKEMAGLGFPEIRGFMKGYIDLVFYWQGRYHILDWKTNYLGTEKADYRARQLTPVMTEEHYILQYLVYTVALHQYLSLRLPGYSYQDHFGGVYYLFLRGLEPDFGGEYGVYYDFPPESLIEDLTAIFKQS
ncbi:MAG: UvrD-helicase domain-containing protein, partial [Desulfobia sp.]